ncbi:MAG TPA: hypothetical protein VG960_00205 [Caulobacteraceae bacterium]|nr:hypothetical protein [Caulobacteraceae bacterium]
MEFRKFLGCDGGDPGSPERPSVWLFGIEPGYSEADNREHGGSQKPRAVEYSIDLQRKWPFNRNAFKLLAALDGRPIDDWWSFASEKQVFAPGSLGYFKGNLFPYACYGLSTWTATAQRDTGFAAKEAYQKACRSERWSQIRQWVDEHRPSLVIGAGTSYASDFAEAFLGPAITLTRHIMSAESRLRPILYGTAFTTKLAVIPHLSRRLSANVALQEAGEFLSKLQASEIAAACERATAFP